MRNRFEKDRVKDYDNGETDRPLGRIIARWRTRAEATRAQPHATGGETPPNGKEDGEPPRTRTWNPLIKSQLLYQLS